jgi:transposase
VAEFVGIDVSKDQLDVCLRPSGALFSATNDDNGIAGLVERLRQTGPALVVLEATGGYEIAVAAALGVAKIPCAVVNPRQVRDFAKALGRLAKTDRIDAAVLAHFGEALKPEPKAVPAADALELEALVGRRRQLIDMLVAEKNRLARAVVQVRPNVKAHIAWLQEKLDELDRELGEAIKRSPLWRERDELLRSIPGVGDVIARTLIADLPELGTLSRGAIASLAGLAPHNHDSGQHRGQRRIWGGRASVRTALYLGALVGTRYNPILRSMYKRLLAAGKSKKSALVACARKLLLIANAILTTGKPWSPSALSAN